MVVGGLLAVTMVVIGVGLSSFGGVPLRGEERLAIGAIVGVVAVGVCSFAAFLVAGMSPLTVAGGIALPGAGALLGLRRHGAGVAAELAGLRRRLLLPTTDRRSARPLLAVAAVAAAVSTRTLALAYQYRPTGIAAGSLAVWSDWAAHLAYAGSFSFGDNRQLDLPLATGWPLRYHFLANFVGALFTTAGVTQPQGLVLGSWIVAIALVPLMFCAVVRLTASRLAAALAVALFVLNGGIGAWYFLTVDVAAHGWRVLTALPQTYARMPHQQLWVDNTISASLYAQRSTQLGVAIGMAALIVVLAARPRGNRRGFAAAGVLIGLSAIVFVHLLFTALVLGALAAFADRRSHRRQWRWFLAPAAVIGLPIAAALNPPTSALRWMLGWLAADADQPWLWFWLRNVGLFLPLFALVVVARWAPARLRRLSAPLWLWFVVPNLIAFHPAAWNNTKFFLFWQWAGAVVIAATLRRLLDPVVRPRADGHDGAGRHVDERWRRAVAVAATAVAVGALTVTGTLDTVRGMQRSSAIPWVSADDVAAAGWLRHHRQDGDVLVYGVGNTSAVAALGGVPAVSGYLGWTFDLGLPDAFARERASREILAGAETALALAEHYGVTIVAIGPHERAALGGDDAFWSAHGELVFAQGEYRLYRLTRSAPVPAAVSGSEDVG